MFNGRNKIIHYTGSHILTCRLRMGSLSTSQLSARSQILAILTYHNLLENYFTSHY